MDGSEKRRTRLLRLLDGGKFKTDVEAALACGIRSPSLSRLRTGASKLNNLKTLEKLARGYDVHICYFFIDEDEYLDLLQKATTILKSKNDSSSVLESIITNLYQGIYKAPEKGEDGRLRKDMDEMKSMMQEILGRKDPPNFPKPASKKSPPLAEE